MDELTDLSSASKFHEFPFLHLILIYNSNPNLFLDAIGILSSMNPVALSSDKRLKNVNKHFQATAIGGKCGVLASTYFRQPFFQSVSKIDIKDWSKVQEFNAYGFINSINSPIKH